MSQNFQLVPFLVPDYLLSYLAFQLNKDIDQTEGNKTIEVDRYSVLGKKILSHIVITKTPPCNSAGNTCFKISNWSGNNYNTVNVSRHFVMLSPSGHKTITDRLKADFNEAMIAFVTGAEFSHKYNGWCESQKRKGIRKAAILEFCKRYNVCFNDKNLESFVKMIQRASVNPQKTSDKFSRKL